ncbi:putative toxin-antitoxin system toxin component, PIN family [Pseudothauera rhizosphaerae]|uniref:Putative toxin-antitoxin system toxin component, PIN family n=1 Tax=Pseudothauera rhizosphaerae TaxID=2565932 RepID=A0A4V3WBY9_9RHOO|nr:putative toxin-antitoxin system toxin component, PIN family [Pseudothauera rhizosphaerae]THF65102.1 putative toxin-antitoxin system toxin component, PIN family [Pseudothauera rhizosphaerae]
MPPLVVLDTNTVMALWFFEDPRLTDLRLRVEAGRLLPACREDALEELRRVLAYRQFGITPERQATLLESYRARVKHAPAPTTDTPALPVCRDPDDQKFLEIARDAGAALLLTRDKALLRLARHRLIRPLFAIVSPDRFDPAG